MTVLKTLLATILTLVLHYAIQTLMLMSVPGLGAAGVMGSFVFALVFSGWMLLLFLLVAGSGGLYFADMLVSAPLQKAIVCLGVMLAAAGLVLLLVPMLLPVRWMVIGSFVWTGVNAGRLRA